MPRNPPRVGVGRSMVGFAASTHPTTFNRPPLTLESTSHRLLPSIFESCAQTSGIFLSQEILHEEQLPRRFGSDLRRGRGAAGGARGESLAGACRGIRHPSDGV